MEGTRQVHFNWQAKVWRYMSHDCEEDEFQEEDTEEIICGQRVVNSRARLHLLEGKIKFARTKCAIFVFLGVLLTSFTPEVSNIDKDN